VVGDRGDAEGGGTIGLDVHVNDNDGTGREDKLMWSDTADLAHGDPRRLGKATLLASGRAEPADAAALTTPANDLAAETRRRVRLCASSTTTSAPTRAG